MLLYIKKSLANNIMAFGTDGDKALFTHNFPQATGVLFIFIKIREFGISLDDFDDKLTCIIPVWNSNVKIKCGTNVMKYHMRKDIRDLGSPPSQFTTNSSEAINARP